MPSSLYTCKSLVSLKLEYEILVDVPRMVCLPSLKTLSLECVRYSDEDSLDQLLSHCPVLEDLYVALPESCGLETLTVSVPSLQRLSLVMYSEDFLDVLVINSPCLKYLKFKGCSYSLDFSDMPMLEEAVISPSDIEKCVRSIRFVKRLSIRSGFILKEALFLDGIVFNQLEHLKLWFKFSNWPKVLARLIKDSPNLRELEFVRIDARGDCAWQKYMDCVPHCLFQNLKSFKWIGVYGWQEEIDLVKYILRKACCLKIATILFEPYPYHHRREEKINVEKMKQELSLSFRASTTCQLVLEIC